MKSAVFGMVMLLAGVVAANAGEFTRVTTGQFNGAVVYRHGKFEASFLPWYGGAMLDVKMAGKTLCNAFPGEGAGQFTVEVGNDMTSGTYDGPGFYEIGVLSGPLFSKNSANEFYAKERTLSKTTYVVVGFMPYFIDSASLDLYVAKGSEGLVATIDTPLTHTISEFQGVGTPFWIAPKIGRIAAIAMLGDETKPGKILRIKEGRMSVKTTVSLAKAGPGSFGGTIYRADIRSDSPNNDECYSAPGYKLLVNDAGIVELLGPGGVSMFNSKNKLTAATVARHKTLVNSPAGLRLEIRTSNTWAPYQEVWIDGRKEYTVQLDLGAVTGESIGWYASCQPGGEVRFSDRVVYDMATTFTATYTARPDGALRCELVGDNPFSVVGPRKFWRFNQVSFGTYDPALSLTKIGAGATYVNGNPLLPYMFKPGTTQGVPMYYGNAAGTIGLTVKPVAAEIDGVHSPGAHSLLMRTPTPQGILHLNALPYEANNVPVSARKIRLVSDWYGGWLK